MTTIDPRFYDLLAHLWRGGAYGYLWTPDDGQGHKSTWWLKVVPGVAVPPFFYDKDAYFGVHPSRRYRSEHERASVQMGDIAAINCLYAEFDHKDGWTDLDDLLAHLLDLGLPEPSVVICSGGGWHVYWLLDAPFVLDTPAACARAIALQYAMVEYSGGDGGAKDLARVLRIPGTYNHKPVYDVPPLVQIVRFDLGHPTSIATLEPLLQPLIDARAQRKTAAAAPAQPVTLDDQTLLDAMWRCENGKLYHALWRGDLSGAGDDHSIADQILCNALAWATGRDLPRMDHLFRQSGLYRDKWERKDYRERTLQNAADTCQTVYDPHHRSPDAQAAIDAAQSIIDQAGTSSPANSAPGQQGAAGGNGGTPPGATIPGATPASPGASGGGPQPTPNLLPFGVDDLGNAQATEALFPGQFAYNSAYGWMAWTGVCWEMDAKAYVVRAINQALAARIVQAASSGNVAAYAKLIRFCAPNAARVNGAEFQLCNLASVALPPDLFDGAPDLLNCPNGTVDLRTGQLLPHDPALHLIHCTPVDYVPGTDYREWLALLAQWLPTDQIGVLQLAMGYSATGHTREEKLYYLYGPTRSGKGTFTETVMAALGPRLTAELGFSTFTTERRGDDQNFDLAPLKPCRVVFASESAEYERLNESKVKRVTGGNQIYCAFKHRDSFNYRPQYTIWLSSNHPINADPDDDAAWGRMRIFHFPNSYLGKEDTTLKERLRTPAMLRQVLAWIVDGARAWYALPGSTIPETPSGATLKADMRGELDALAQWIVESCAINPQYTEANSTLYSNYETWCKINGVLPKKQKAFTQTMKKHGYANQHTNRGNIWHGIKVAYGP